MGQKVNPISFRLIKSKDWRSSWFSGRHYSSILAEDLLLRKAIKEKLAKTGGIDHIDISRSGQEITLSIHTSRPGIIIGREGKGIEELKKYLEKKLAELREKAPSRTYPKLKIDILEIRTPELSSSLVAQTIASQLEKRVSYKKAVRQALTKVMEKGARGVKIRVAGRLDGVEIARRETFSQGSIPLGTIKAKVDYAHGDAFTIFGTIGIKVWIYKPGKEVDYAHAQKTETS